MITNLYNNSDKTAVTNNSITYNYATSVNLMNDRKGSMSTNIDSGNIRYYGANPIIIFISIVLIITISHQAHVNYGE